jgi:alpha-ketoglutarate-dependent 2,4-dichlorophenoxyacetate dioxygenase
MTLAAKPLHPLFGAEASGIDLRRVPDAATVRAVEQAMDRYAVLVFRGQPLTEDEQVAFAGAFGKLDIGLNKATRSAPQRYKHAETIDISNVDASGAVYGREHRKIVSTVANQFWHSDSSFQRPAARYSMLHAVVCPEKGGETEYCDLRAAYDALPQDLKDEIANLKCEHYALHSRIALGETYTEAEKNALPPVEWPLVRVHPGSGRKVLWVGIHATHIKGMSLAEGRMLLADLLEHATQREFVYRHSWRPGDLVIWDNRCTLHRGRRFDLSARRELRRTTTEDREAA